MLAWSLNDSWASCFIELWAFDSEIHFMWYVVVYCVFHNARDEKVFVTYWEWIELIRMLLLLFTDRISVGGNAIASVCPSVCPPICFRFLGGWILSLHISQVTLRGYVPFHAHATVSATEVSLLSVLMSGMPYSTLWLTAYVHLRCYSALCIKCLYLLST